MSANVFMHSGACSSRLLTQWNKLEQERAVSCLCLPGEHARVHPQDRRRAEGQGEGTSSELKLLKAHRSCLADLLVCCFVRSSALLMFGRHGCHDVMKSLPSFCRLSGGDCSGSGIANSQAGDIWQPEFSKPCLFGQVIALVTQTDATQT